MAKTKKYYAVRKGLETGIFHTWEECREKVSGYPNAEYKSFSSEAEAYEYLGLAGSGNEKIEKVGTNAETEDFPEENCLLAYVDGSYNDAVKKYAFGCVFLLPDKRIFTEFGNGDHPEALKQRNVSGEMAGAMYAVKFALKNGFRAVEIRYDYQGIECWVTGAWQAKNALTQSYASSMREWGKSVQISFTKVAAHTNVKYNELADQMAKKGLTDGNGVPAVRLISEMSEYQEE